MTKTAMLLKYFFLLSIKVLLKLLLLTRRPIVPKTIYQLLFWPIYCKSDGPSNSKYNDIQPLHHKVWENMFFEVGQCSLTTAERKNSAVPGHKKCWAVKIANHHDKQLTYMSIILFKLCGENFNKALAM